jgi:hypothetical protein
VINFPAGVIPSRSYTCRSRSGSFATINGLQQSGYSFTPDYDSGDFTLGAN